MTFILLGDDTDDEMEHELYDELSRAMEAMIISWQPLHVRVHSYRLCTYHRKTINLDRWQQGLRSAL